MVPSMHCSITLFIVTIVEVHVLIYDDFVCYCSLMFWFFLTDSTTVDLVLQFCTTNVLLEQHNR